MNSEALAETASAAKARILPFGKYLLLQRVSVGGMAEVFKALPEGATRVDQIVAIKRILPNIAEDAEFIGMFVDEARLAGQLNHPNVCRIYELGRVGDDHYIAMQFLWGRDLLKVMNRFKRTGQAFPAPLAAFIAAKACAALHYAHTKCDATGKPLQIIHRDVSPQNIIVAYSGQVKLIDFGVARAASHIHKTQAGILKGKFGYMSPEMIRGLPIDHRSDVFAMGICLHEALTGARLFYGETDFATLELVRAAKVPPPSHTAPGVTPELDAIVLKALSRNVDERYPSAQALQEALEHFLNSHYPGFGEAEVGVIMREAFQFEVTREKLRLDVFTDMLQQGTLVRGALLPPLPYDAPPTISELEGAEGDLVSLSGESVTRRSELSDEELARLSDQPPGVHDERTQIFFSAEELDEIRELDTTESIASLEPVPVERPSTPEVPNPNLEQSPVAATMRPVFEREDAQSHESPKPSRTSSWPMLIAAALALLSAGYFGARLEQNRSASLEIAAVGEADAIVRVDGVVRGNPPLFVQDLRPGVHEIEVEAKGYTKAHRKIYVGPGQIIPVNLVLERKVPKPKLRRVMPVVETRPSTPANEVVPPDQDKSRTSLRRKENTEPPRALPEPTLEPKPPTANETAAPSTKGGNDSHGKLLISTVPWSRVFIDDVDTGRDTPVRALQVEPGAHRIGLRTPDGVMHTVDVQVAPGEVVRIVRRFEEPAAESR